MDNYLQILEDSLIKKVDILKRIRQLNSEQEQLLKNTGASFLVTLEGEETTQTAENDRDRFMEEIDQSMERKGELIVELSRLDNGFSQLYDRVREQLMDHKDQYKDQIRRMQDLVAEIMEKSASVQVQEKRNKKLLDEYFSNTRKELKSGRLNSKAAMDYYRNMNQTKYTHSYIMDQKK